MSEQPWSAEGVELANAVQLLLAGESMQVGMDALCRVITVSTVAGFATPDEACAFIDALAEDAKADVQRGWDYIRQRIAKTHQAVARA